MARLTRVITVRLSPEEFEDIRSQAAFRGITTSVILRELLLSHSAECDDAANQVLREILAMRTIMINLLHLIGTHTVLTVDTVSEIIRQADQKKARRACARPTQKGDPNGKDSE